MQSVLELWPNDRHKFAVVAAGGGGRDLYGFSNNVTANWTLRMREDAFAGKERSSLLRSPQQQQQQRVVFLFRLLLCLRLLAKARIYARGGTKLKGSFLI